MGRRAAGGHGIVLVLALLAVGAGVSAGCRRNGTPPPSMPSKLHAASIPDFARPTLAGGRLDTKSLRGKVLVVKFVAEYCAPCKRTLPAAEAMHRSYAGDVVFVGISEDPLERNARALARAYGLTFPMVHDVGNVLAGRFRVTEIPVTFVVDPQGVVRWVGGPGMTPEDLRSAIRTIR